MDHPESTQCKHPKEGNRLFAKGRYKDAELAYEGGLSYLRKDLESLLESCGTLGVLFISIPTGKILRRLFPAK
jgi:hypothetical protein